jgi:hypothetical protein
MAYTNLRDGDAIVTSHGFIFYVFGYDHPRQAYNAFLKYAPEELAGRFDIDWLEVKWLFEGRTLLRPKELYSPDNLGKLIESFLRSFPDYVRRSRELGRCMIIVPWGLIERAFVPSRRLMELFMRGASDSLEERALSLVDLLSKGSGVGSGHLGIHGSISLGMHHEGSDIDIAVYGGDNYRRVKRALVAFDERGTLTLKRDDAISARRLNRGVFRGVDFVVNAIRRYHEIVQSDCVFRPLCAADVKCRCTSADEAVFRPAIYRVEDCEGLGNADPRISRVLEVVSMIGLYRDVVRVGERIRARGMLEEGTDAEGNTIYRVVVGSGSPAERISWFDD